MRIYFVCLFFLNIFSMFVSRLSTYPDSTNLHNTVRSAFKLSVSIIIISSSMVTSIIDCFTFGASTIGIYLLFNTADLIVSKKSNQNFACGVFFLGKKEDKKYNTLKINFLFLWRYF